MRIIIVTPAPPSSRNGNRMTARRWARILKRLRHRVRIQTEYNGQTCDLLVALHASRSAPSISRYRKQNPDRPLIVALTGTDIYRDHHNDVRTQQSLELADHVLVLQPKAKDVLPPKIQLKTHVFYQSATAPPRHIRKTQRTFDVCVIGHLRAIKDPLRAAFAVRGIDKSSRIRIVHVGEAMNDGMKRDAKAEMKRNPRYLWLGNKAQWEARRILARSHAMVLSSRAEGGANVISEAVVASVPILSSRIDGSVGLLGENYEGYFPEGDTARLQELLLRAETDAGFLRTLRSHVNDIKHRFAPSAERRAWQELLRRL